MGGVVQTTNYNDPGQKMIDIEQTPLDGVLLIKPRVFGDARGYFLETYHQIKYADAGLGATFVQDNHSRSQRNILRGLHYQLNQPQGKLVMTTRGEIFDVAVDIRQGSPTFAQWVGYTLSDENHHQLYIPPGFAHGFCVLSEIADVVYKCTDFYNAADDRGVLWNDDAIGIAWPITDPQLSEKDAQQPSLAEAGPDCLPRFAPA